MTAAARAAAVDAGVDNLIAFLDDPAHFQAHWYDFVLEFANVARTATEPALRDRAAAQVAAWNARARDVPLTLEGNATLWDCSAFACAALGSALLDLPPVVPPGRLADLARRRTATLRRGHGPPRDRLRGLKYCLDHLIAAYLGYRLGFPLGYGFGGALQRALALRPYPDPAGLDPRRLRRVGAIVTHIAYTVSDYHERAVDPALLAPERAFLQAALDAAVAVDDGEIGGEILDALRVCGVADGDPAWESAAAWLASRQNADGGWGDPQAARSVRRYHVTMAAVQGLRAYREASADAHPWIADLLRGTRSGVAVRRNAPPADDGVPRLAAAPATLVQLAARRRPAVLDGAAKAMPAWQRWTDAYLLEKAGEAEIAVEVADDEVFARPDREIERERTTLAAYLSGAVDDGRQRYLAQVPLTGALAPLAEELALDQVVPAGRHHDPLLWLSAAPRVTALHFDLLDNVLLVLDGCKRLTLFPPHQGLLLYRCRTAKRQHFSDVDLDAPDLARFPLFAKASPTVVDVAAGDALLIPAGWWHHVRSTGRTLAVSVFWSRPEA